MADARGDGDFLTPFEPAYPPLTPGGYDTFINGFNLPIIPEGAFIDTDILTVPANDIAVPVPGLSSAALFDVDGDGQRNDERCDTDAEGVQQFALAAASAADTLGNTICNAITPDTAEAPCWATFGVLQQAIVIGQTVAAQCDFQDALVDGAEIEAGYENTVKLIGLNTKIYEKQLEDNLLDCTPVIGLMVPEADGGLAEWVAMFVGQRIDQFEATIGDAKRVSRADGDLADGLADLNNGFYEDAYKHFCKAYGHLAIGK